MLNSDEYCKERIIMINEINDLIPIDIIFNDFYQHYFQRNWLTPEAFSPHNDCLYC